MTKIMRNNKKNCKNENNDFFMRLKNIVRAADRKRKCLFAWPYRPDTQPVPMAISREVDDGPETIPKSRIYCHGMGQCIKCYI